MLDRDKIKVFGLCLLSILITNSCKNKSVDKFYKQNSLYVTSEVTYNKVYKQANETVNNWIDNNLTIAKAYNVSNWKIDSLLCFNKRADRCVLCIYRQYNNEVNNAIDFLYGVKISNKWYFFEGAVIYIFSEKYGYNPKTSLPFSKLHEIAMKEVFSGYLIEKKKDAGWWKNLFAPEYEYKINEHFFDELNTPLVAFAERKTNPNCPLSCRVIDNEKEYAECLLKKQALSIWNEERAYIKNDTYLYAPELPIGKRMISTINKGESFKVIEYIDNTEWVYVRMSAHNPNLGLIHKNEISKSKL